MTNKEKNGKSFDEMTKVEDKSEFYDILTQLVKGDTTDIDLKSEVKNPRLLVVLNQISNYCDEVLELPKSAKTLKDFLYKYLRIMFSFKRGSRKEIENIMKAMGLEFTEKDKELTTGLRL